MIEKFGDEISAIFPNDFEVVSEDIPSLAGIKEGDGTITYKIKNYPYLGHFIAYLTYMENLPHGPIYLIHNSKELLKAKYQYGRLYMGREECKFGILINRDGCRIVRNGTSEPKSCSTLLKANQHTSSKVTEKANSIKEDTNNLSYNAEQEINDIKKEEEESSYEDSSNVESYDEYEENDNEIYEAYDEYDFAVTKHPKYNPESIELKRYEDIAKNMLCDSMNVRFYSITYQNNTTWYILSSSLLLKAKTNNSRAQGQAVLYSISPFKAVCVIMFSNDEIDFSCYPNTTEKQRRNDVSIIDLDADGSRWEGEIRNMKPNGIGQFYDCENNLIYEGEVKNGKPHGWGIEFYPTAIIKRYEGYFNNGMKHGYGKLYDLNEKFLHDAVWVQDKELICQPFPSKLSPDLKLSDYNTITRVMYIASYEGNSITVSDFPYLRALFINKQTRNNISVHLSNLPRLKKYIMFGSDHKSNDWSLSPSTFTISYCPSLREVWLFVQMEHGCIYLQKNDKSEKRFVLQELEKTMKWKRKPGIHMRKEDTPTYVLCTKYDDYYSDPAIHGLYEDRKFYILCNSVYMYHGFDLSINIYLPFHTVDRVLDESLHKIGRWERYQRYQGYLKEE